MSTILQDGAVVATIANVSRTTVLYELNLWFLHYFSARLIPIRQLPPLDNWTMDKEQYDAWSVHFPDSTWTVTLTVRPSL